MSSFGDLEQKKRPKERILSKWNRSANWKAYLPSSVGTHTSTPIEYVTCFDGCQKRYPSRDLITVKCLNFAQATFSRKCHAHLFSGTKFSRDNDIHNSHKYIFYNPHTFTVDTSNLVWSYIIMPRIKPQSSIEFIAGAKGCLCKVTICLAWQCFRAKCLSAKIAEMFFSAKLKHFTIFDVMI